MCRLVYLLPLCIALLAAPVSAEQTISLYTTDTLVLSQSNDARNEAIRDSLGDIVVRISGRRDSLEHELVAKALTRPAPYLSSFSYGKTDQRLDVDGVEVVATELTLKFSPSAVEGLLRRAELPLWPANRASVLLWLVQDDRQDGRIYASDSEYLEQIERTAIARGLPLEHPLLDLEDQMVVSVDDLWNFNGETLRSASTRYDADITVVGRFSEISRGGQTQWLANWQILRPDGDSLIESQGDSASAALLEGIELISDDLASRYAIVMSDSLDTALTLQLSSVSDFGAYAQSIDYLESLAMVVSAKPHFVKENELWLSLETEGGLDLLLNALQSDEKLLSAKDTSVRLSDSRYAPLGSVANPLRYYWLMRPETVGVPESTAINSLQLLDPMQSLSGNVTSAASND
jgi:hypothetical protein